MTISNSLPTMTYTPLRDEVLTTLRQALIGGGFAAGERIREVELANQLGVSRGTLREAFRHLEQEGLIVTAPHRGTTVVNPTATEIREIFGLRIALESYAAEQAAQLATADDLNALQAVADDFHALCFSEGVALAPRVNMDLYFHELICAAGGNARLLRTWTELCGPVRLLLSALNAPFLDSADVIEQHQRIIDALRAGDGATAREMLTAHLVESRDRMVQTLQERSDETTEGIPSQRP